MTEEEPTPRPPTFSVLIGRVSTQDSRRILETLEALRRQEGAHSYEVIIGDRRNDATSREIEATYPEARLIALPAGTSLPALRTAALDRARGRYVVVTEDHCVPADGWLEGIAQAFARAPPDTVAVGGCVENGVRDTPLDWATFFCEYSALLEPVTEGPSDDLPGMNVAYDRAILRGVDRSLLTDGFWETTVHPALVRSGGTLYSTSGIKLFHCKRFSVGHFARQRFAYSRYYAGLRFGRGRHARRLVALALTPLLPALLLLRIVRQVRSRHRLGAELASALPMLAVFVTVWAWGEMVGYALGPGDALARIE